MEQTSTRRRVIVALALGLPVSVLLGLLAFRNADPEEVVDALREARLAEVLAAVGVFGVMYLLQAVRWRLVAATPHVRVRTFAAMVVSGIAVNNVLPGRIGDLLRARWLAVEARITSGRALATVVLDRTGDVLALTVLLAVSVARTDVPQWVRAVGLGAALAVGLTVGGILLARAYAARRPRERRERRRVRRVARDLLDGLAEPLGTRRALGALGLSLASWLAFAVAAMLVADAVGIDLTLTEAALVTGVVNLGVAIPSSPGFVGTYQWLVVEAVALLDVATREQALALSILLHAAWYVPTTLVGGAVVISRLGGLALRRPAPPDPVPSTSAGAQEPDSDPDRR